MSSLKERKRSLNLEKDLMLTKGDFGTIRDSPPHEPRDLGSYLDFLDELWQYRSKGKKIGKGFYSEQFRL
jgi:hypothetical protein